MLEKLVFIDCIEVIKDGCVQVCTRTSIMEDGEQLSSTLHRNVIAPGDNYSAEDAKVQTICAAVHTPEVVIAYKEAQNVTPTA